VSPVVIATSGDDPGFNHLPLDRLDGATAYSDDLRHVEKIVIGGKLLSGGRRATSATLQGHVLSATIDAFSSLVRPPRRSVPVISSTRRYESASCLS
jgi:hypothetical protein